MAANSADVTPEDIIRFGAQLASLLDPTGVSDVIGAFTYAKCSKLNL
jgi:hypothetical protein